MRKITHSKFQLELSHLKLSDVEQTHWFSDSIFTKYSLPFDIILDEATSVLFDFVQEFESLGTETLFDVIYTHHDMIYKAIFEIEEIDGDFMSCTIRYGFDEFPNFNKKLSELPFAIVEVANIYQYAKTVITKTFPEVNYNFPQIHVDKIENSEDDDTWFAFENILNNYKNGEFIENEVDLEEEIIYNRNIIQPLPYLLYVLKTGFESEGYNLTGDFVNHNLFKKVLLYSELNYYEEKTFESVDLSISHFNDELVIESRAFQVYVFNTNFQHLFRKYRKSVNIPEKGKYRISGSVIIGQSIGNLSSEFSGCNIYYNGILVFSETNNSGTYPYGGINRKTLNVDVVIDTSLTDATDEVMIEVLTTDRNFLLNEDIIPSEISELSINPIALHSEDGEIVPTINNENKVDISRAVPDMTFGELVTTLKNWFNLDIGIKENEIFINFVEDQINFFDAKDISEHQVPKPKLSFHKGISFLLKFQNVESEDYNFAPVFHSGNMITNEGYVTDEKTNEININALPLPLAYKKGVLTAHSFLKDNTKPLFVVYDGLVNNLNLTKNANELNLPEVHDKFHKTWFNFRIRSVGFKWTFSVPFEIAYRLGKKVFAYGNYHVVKSVNRNEIAPDFFETEIETESLK